MLLICLLIGCSTYDSAVSSDTPSPKTHYPIKVSDACGLEINFAKKPDQVVIQSQWEKEFIEEIGGTGEYILFEGKGIGGANHETERRIAAELKPDLVIIMSQGYLLEGDCKNARYLLSLGIHTYVSDQSTLKKITDEMITIGNILNHQSEASRASEQLRSTVELVEKSVAPLQRKTVYWEHNISIEYGEIKQYYALGPITLEDEMLKLAGGKNITRNDSRMNPYNIPIKLDDIIVANPSHILISGHLEKQSAGLYKKIQERPEWSNLNAVKQKQVLELPILFGSVSSLRNDLIMLVEFLHPDLRGNASLYSKQEG
ncbi:ABC transporter substrate-binding protein [Paenibacillus chitinolyticus]|uniref:ABC transporter substrate-binding protein n=1 Tax=Paenibacillus chitinolyticus TaxID=79263 RepID=UPI001C48D4BB|nr:ABC transporter substrate-binding protein [Paenibacillus chitinolyticus]MBV6713583.1 ABC transporter substrate-binding protein [Paenibacillus chitinolyticus]